MNIEKNVIRVGYLIIFCTLVSQNKASRILVVLPTPSISHQLAIRDFTQELVRRGHDVVVITTDPAFPKGKTPVNLTEIDVHDAGYEVKGLNFFKNVNGRSSDLITQVIEYFRLFPKILKAEILTDEVQTLINDKSQKFDLLIIEACTRSALIFSHIFNAPVILFSTFGVIEMFNEYTGAATHPLLYPTITHQRLFNLTLWEKAYEFYKHFTLVISIKALESAEEEMMKNIFGSDVPPLSQLKNNIEMVYVTQYHAWDSNRPVPSNMVYLGGLYPRMTAEVLPKDLQTYLDSSVNGVIYVSFGTSVISTLLPEEMIKTILKVFSQLPFDVMLKWDSDDLPNISKNVKIFKWVPQSNVLRHPKIKLFITQGGLQSTEDALAAGVPLIGMPLLGDQWYNVEQYVRLNIGLRLDVESVTEETMLRSINTILVDESYRRNIESLRSLLRDQPQSALDRAVWWAEHVIRHKGARHLRAPTALISYWDYFELDLVLMVIFSLILIVIAFSLLLYCLFLFASKIRGKLKIE